MKFTDLLRIVKSPGLRLIIFSIVYAIILTFILMLVTLAHKLILIPYLGEKIAFLISALSLLSLLLAFYIHLSNLDTRDLF